MKAKKQKTVYENLIKDIERESGAIPGKVLTFQELVGIKNREPFSNNYCRNICPPKELLSKFDPYSQMRDVVSDYNKASNARERYKAESRICRIVDSTGLGTIIYAQDGRINPQDLENGPFLNYYFENDKDLLKAYTDEIFKNLAQKRPYFPFFVPKG